MAINRTAEPKSATKAATTADKTGREAKTRRAKIQGARKMDAGVIGYTGGSRFSDEEVRDAIRRALSSS